MDKDSGNACLKIQIFYLTLMNMLSFVAPALFMYTIHIAMYTFQSNVIVDVLQQLGMVANGPDAPKNNVVGIFVYVIDFIYAMIFLGLVFFSMHLTNREGRFKGFFYGVSTLYGIFSLSVFGVLLYDIISGFFTGKNECNY